MEWTRDEAVAAMVEYWTKWVRGEGDPALAHRPTRDWSASWLARVANRAEEFERALRPEVENAYDCRVGSWGAQHSTLYNDYHPEYGLGWACRVVWPSEPAEYDLWLFPRKTRTWFTPEGVPMVDESWRGPGRELPKKEGPQFKHDCEACIFLGRWTEPEKDGVLRVEYDLYVCPRDWMARDGQHTCCVARYSSDGPRYASMTLSNELWDESLAAIGGPRKSMYHCYIPALCKAWERWCGYQVKKETG